MHFSDWTFADWVIYAYVFYLMFVVAMGTLAAWSKLSIVPRVLLAPALVVAVLMDVVFNLFIGTVIFLDPPREMLFTQRLDRYEEEGSGWRYPIALWICRNLLNPFQSGGHCTK